MKHALTISNRSETLLPNWQFRGYGGGGSNDVKLISCDHPTLYRCFNWSCRNTGWPSDVVPMSGWWHDPSNSCCDVPGGSGAHRWQLLRSIWQRRGARALRAHNPRDRSLFILWHFSIEGMDGWMSRQDTTTHSLPQISCLYLLVNGFLNWDRWSTPTISR